jgi:hypothetical protein
MLSSISISGGSDRQNVRDQTETWNVYFEFIAWPCKPRFRVAEDIDVVITKIIDDAGVDIPIVPTRQFPSKKKDMRLTIPASDQNMFVVAPMSDGQSTSGDARIQFPSLPPKLRSLQGYIRAQVAPPPRVVTVPARPGAIDLSSGIQALCTFSTREGYKTPSVHVSITQPLNVQFPRVETFWASTFAQQGVENRFDARGIFADESGTTTLYVAQSAGEQNTLTFLLLDSVTEVQIPFDLSDVPLGTLRR